MAALSSHDQGRTPPSLRTEARVERPCAGRQHAQLETRLDSVGDLDHQQGSEAAALPRRTDSDRLDVARAKFAGPDDDAPLDHGRVPDDRVVGPSDRVPAAPRMRPVVIREVAVECSIDQLPRRAACRVRHARPSRRRESRAGTWRACFIDYGDASQLLAHREDAITFAVARESWSDTRQHGRSCAAELRAGDGDVVEFFADTCGAQEQRAPAHVTPADLGRWKEQPAVPEIGQPRQGLQLPLHHALRVPDLGPHAPVLSGGSQDAAAHPQRERDHPTVGAVGGEQGTVRIHPSERVQIAVGRDTLLTALGLPDPQTFQRRRNDPLGTGYPTQVKAFIAPRRFQFTPYVYGPGFDETRSARQHGGGLLAGLDVWKQRALVGMTFRKPASDAFDRHSVGANARLEFGRWGILTEHDLTMRVDAARRGTRRRLHRRFTQLLVAPLEWFVTSLQIDNVAVTGLNSSAGPDRDAKRNGYGGGCRGSPAKPMSRGHVQDQGRDRQRDLPEADARSCDLIARSTSRSHSRSG